MSERISSISNFILQLSILGFTVALIWFVFVYYPKIVKQYQAGIIPIKPFVPVVVAEYNKFPIETAAFRLVHEKSDVYYAFVNGITLDEFVDNKNLAGLALKTALSVDNLCSYNVLFISTAKLNVPPQYKELSGCK